MCAVCSGRTVFLLAFCFFVPLVVLFRFFECAYSTAYSLPGSAYGLFVMVLGVREREFSAVAAAILSIDAESVRENSLILLVPLN
jgi:hypothetical protein